MRITAEMSLYPLHAGALDKILSFIATLHGDARLEIVVNQLSTQVRGELAVVMQAIVTEAGIAVIEVNARFGGASTASLSVGLDMLYWSLFERARPGAPPPAFDRRLGEIRQVRVAEDIVIRDPDL